MKKIIALFLSFTFIFCLCGCSDDQKQETEIDIAYYANLGQIPESEFVLGDTGEAIEKKLNEKKTQAEEKGEEFHYDKIEGENNVLITDGVYEYYYKKAAPEKGIGYMAAYADSYGLKLGTVIVEAKEKLDGNDVKEEAANEENAFFYRGNIDDSVVLKIEGEKRTVIFIFENNALCATAIYNNDWN